MKTLLLQLAAPLQAWDVDSRFSERDTLLEPTKSGVVGLLAAALGRRRSGPFDDLNALRMGVRVDREGRKMRDFHTVGGGTIPSRCLARYGVKNYGVSRASGSGTEAALSRRYYLADARFLIALATDDEGLLNRIVSALHEPVFPLFLGRKAFVPTEPILTDADKPLRDGNSLQEVLESEPWNPTTQDLEHDWKLNAKIPRVGELRLVLEVDEKEVPKIRETRVVAEHLDIPISFNKTDRTFRKRHTQTLFTSKPIQQWLDSNMAKEESA